MDYPAWIVGGIGPGWIIGLIATFHVLISHFAVGGGIFLPFTEAWARKHDRPEVISFLKDFSRFFLILTNVFGAISGVGIWWAITIVSPQASASLIRMFTFVWGAEWAVFLVEILSLVFYYYGWERMKPETHLKVGWIYAVTAWLSLFTINGILTFMLTPGGWTGSGSLLQAYFNPGFLPSLLVRTLVCIACAAVYATFVISKLDDKGSLKKELLAYVSKWLVPTFVLLVPCLIWYYGVLPGDIMGNLLSGLTASPGLSEETQEVVLGMPTVTKEVIMGMLIIVTTGLAFFVSAYLNPREFSRGKAALLLAGLAVFVVTFEHSREMLRKPYVIRDFMFSNGVPLKATVDKPLNRSFTEEMRFKPKGSEMGQQMFVGQCMACHTSGKGGYRSLAKLLKGYDENSIYGVLTEMQQPGKENRYHRVMPPLIGTEEELRALSSYLYEVVSEANAGDSHSTH